MEGLFKKVYRDYKDLSKDKKDFFLRFREIKVQELRAISPNFYLFGLFISVLGLFVEPNKTGILIVCLGIFIATCPIWMFNLLIFSSEKFLKEK